MTTMQPVKRTRAERKAESRARFARLALIEASSKLEREREMEHQRVIRAEYEKNHPVSAGLIPLVDYVPPR